MHKMTQCDDSTNPATLVCIIHLFLIYLLEVSIVSFYFFGKKGGNHNQVKYILHFKNLFQTR